MAYSSTTIIEVQLGGSDTANAGGFDPAVPGAATNGAATVATGTAPVFTSATYNFVAGDVGHWLFIKSGTNWIPGWYQIGSVAANAATLTATIGAGQLFLRSLPLTATTATGCATTASPTGATWSIDYSRSASAAVSITGATTSGATAILLTSSATVAMAGNTIHVTGGTNFTTGFYAINSISAGVSLTLDRNCASGVGASGAASVGGALASPGQAAALVHYVIFILYNASAFVATTASTNTAGGCVLAGDGFYYQGYSSGSDRNLSAIVSSRPTFQVGSSVSAATLFGGQNNDYRVMNLILDGNLQTTSRGVSFNGRAVNCKIINCTNNAMFSNPSGGRSIGCEVSGCTTAVATSQVNLLFCTIHDNTAGGTSAGNNITHSIAYGNTGVGFNSAIFLTNCVAYNNSSHGMSSGNNVGVFVNCVSEANGGYGFTENFASLTLVNCASYNNTSGRVAVLSGLEYTDSNPITGSGTFFMNAASGNFGPNNTTGTGALIRAAGYSTTFPGGLTANYLDVGAAQHLDSIRQSGPITAITYVYADGG